VKALVQAFSRGTALMPFLMAGHPTPAAFAANLAAAAEFADVIEVGVPFSDPLADGPVIQSAAAQALKHGTTLASTLDEIRSRKAGPPVVLMLSINQVLATGLEGFARRAAEAGVSGAIIPDLPFEESAQARDVFTRQGLALIAMLAPTTSEARMRAILKQAQGFVYLISVAGVTGTRDSFPPETIDYIRRACELSPVPVCVGFGISKPAHIEQLREHADGLIVGSALIRGLDEGRSVRDMLAPLKSALTGAHK
jgi:tryptophan synthase alpha chain